MFNRNFIDQLKKPRKYKEKNQKCEFILKLFGLKANL